MDATIPPMFRSSPDVGGDRRTALVGATAYGFVAKVDPAFGEQSRNITQAIGKRSHSHTADRIVSDGKR
jgi:hypothetical protein